MDEHHTQDSTRHGHETLAAGSSTGTGIGSGSARLGQSPWTARRTPLLNRLLEQGVGGAVEGQS